VSEVTWREKWGQLAAVGCGSSRESLRLLVELEELKKQNALLGEVAGDAVPDIWSLLVDDERLVDDIRQLIAVRHQREFGPAVRRAVLAERARGELERQKLQDELEWLRHVVVAALGTCPVRPSGPVDLPALA
jgi:hypothetical protein